MRKSTKSRLLWVDDQIAGLDSYVKALRHSGFLADGARSATECMRLATQRSYHVILVDLKMQKTDGITLLRKVRSVQPSAILAAYSSYLYMDTYRNRLRKMGFDVELIDKDFPNVHASDFQRRFIAPIKELARRGVRNTITTIDGQVETIRSCGVNPFDLSLEEYIRKSVAEKDQLSLRALKLADPLLEREFRSGAVWVLIVSEKEVVAKAKSSDEVPSEEVIRQIARQYGRPVYQFFRPIRTEDMWCEYGSESSLADYPTLTVEIPDSRMKSTSRYDVHFDTGSPMTFFSYEELLKLNAVEPTNDFTVAKRNEVAYFCATLRLDITLRGQEKGTTRKATLRGQAVREWDSGPYARHCVTNCLDGKRTTERTLCPNRKGLIGRNVLTENSLVVILNGKKKTSDLIEE